MKCSHYVSESRPYIFLTARVHPGESNSSWVMKGKALKGCSHGSFAIVIYFSQLMGFMGFSFAVAIAPCEHLQ